MLSRRTLLKTVLAAGLGSAVELSLPSRVLTSDSPKGEVGSQFMVMTSRQAIPEVSWLLRHGKISWTTLIASSWQRGTPGCKA